LCCNWLQLDLVYQYQPSDWLRRLRFAPIRRLAGKVVSNVTCTVSSGMLNPATACTLMTCYVSVAMLHSAKSLAHC